MADTLPPLREREFDTGEVRLHLVEAGPTTGRPVLLLHGFPEFWYGWRGQIGQLAAAGYRVVVPDQRGYNLSEKPDRIQEYRVDHLAADAAAIAEDAGGAVDLIGHDWGAAVAWHAAMRYPARVRRLAILNVPHPAEMASALRRSWGQRFRSWYILFFQIPWLPERLLGWKNAAGLACMLRSSGRPTGFSGADLQRYREAWLQPGAIRGMLSWYRAALRNSSETFLARQVQVPTLILWGERDVALETSMAQASLKWCKDGRLVTFPRASHWVQHDEAQAVNRQLLEFMGPSRANQRSSAG
ncbi:MAG: alpha/beta hydrolase [Anaerolineales bacterium]|jgi:pimeloyl-ACP methyl ester carboxylesterase